MIYILIESYMFDFGYIILSAFDSFDKAETALKRRIKEQNNWESKTKDSWENWDYELKLNIHAQKINDNSE